MSARLAGAALALAAALLFSACGDDDTEEGRAEQRLQAQVAAVEYAVAGGDYDAARQGLNRIRATTIRFADRGHLDALRATEILDAVEATDLVLIRMGGRDPDPAPTP